MIESTIYAKLTGETSLTALVGTNIFPVAASENAELPLVIYSVQTELNRHLNGVCDLKNSTVTIDAYAINADTVLAVGAAVYTALATVSPTYAAYLLTQATVAEEAGFHCQQIFAVFC